MKTVQSQFVLLSRPYIEFVSVTNVQSQFCFSTKVVYNVCISENCVVSIHSSTKDIY